MRLSPITISTTDHRQLVRLINSARLDWRIPAESLDALQRELSRAMVVKASELPGDVVAMNSTVWFRDLDFDEIEKYMLVYPSYADVLRDRISVLAPIGTALLGFRVGDIVQWRVPSGERRFEIVAVSHDTMRPRVEEPKRWLTHSVAH